MSRRKRADVAGGSSFLVDSTGVCLPELFATGCCGVKPPIGWICGSGSCTNLAASAKPMLPCRPSVGWTSSAPGALGMSSMPGLCGITLFMEVEGSAAGGELSFSIRFSMSSSSSSSASGLPGVGLRPSLMALMISSALNLQYFILDARPSSSSPNCFSTSIKVATALNLCAVVLVALPERSSSSATSKICRMKRRSRTCTSSGENSGMAFFSASRLSTRPSRKRMTGSELSCSRSTIAFSAAYWRQ
mmetsp:Transcript_16899/g.64366  ORF Transcript_16899/g.64366 Transcript_16899/m.64366 type:complete len:247 (+) Transcript_16899:387-1127(+)